MASSRRTAANTVAALLKSEPYLFSFVQAVRILERSSNDHWAEGCLGHDNLPKNECVRLVGYAARSFPPAEVVNLENIPVEPDGRSLAKLTVAFMGLFGPSGVLPYHDTQRLIDAGIKENPERDFLDMFNHRVLSLYYRASTKYRLPFAYEIAYRDTSPDHDAMTRAFYAVSGMATDGLRGRLEYRDELAIEFAGLLAQQSKNAISLQRMLEAYFKLTVAILQFVGQWVFLSAENQSEMPSQRLPAGKNCILGESFILGERIWDVSAKFRLRLGPLSLEQFDAFLPGSRKLTELSQMTQFYAGRQYDFDVQLVLSAAQVPRIHLGEHSRLGFNTWLITEQPVDDVSDAIFCYSGLPCKQLSANAA